MNALSKLSPLSLAALLALGTGPAAAADRYWSFTAGCSSFDFTSFCWRASPAGVAGVSPPVAGDNVFIVQSAATELTVRAINTVNYVLPKYQSLLLNGSGAAPAGLLLDRGTLSVVGTVVGDTGRGHITQTGGLAVLDGLTLGYTGTGRYDLQGGELRTQNLAVGLAGTGDMVQTGGWLSVSGLLGISPGSTLRTDGGTLDLRGVTGSMQYPSGSNRVSTLYMGGGNVLTNVGQTLRADRVFVAGGGSEMLRNTLLETNELAVSGPTRTVELDARVISASTTVQASAANGQVTVNLRGQGSHLGNVMIGSDYGMQGTGRGVLQVLAGAQVTGANLSAGNDAGGAGQLRVNGAGSTLALTSGMSFGFSGATNQPYSELVVDQGGRIDANLLVLFDSGAAQVMSGGRVALSSQLSLVASSVTRAPSLLISDGGVVSAGWASMGAGTTLGITGPNSTLTTLTLLNTGTTFLEGLGVSITGTGGVGTPLTMTNAGLLDVRSAAVAHVAGAVQNGSGATVNVGTGATLRMASYSGAGTLGIGSNARVQIDGAVQNGGGTVNVANGASLRMGSYSGAGALNSNGTLVVTGGMTIESGETLTITGTIQTPSIVNRGRLDITLGALRALDGDIVRVLDNQGDVFVWNYAEIGSYTGHGRLILGGRTAEASFRGAVRRESGSFTNVWSRQGNIYYSDGVTFDLRQGGILDEVPTSFLGNTVTLELGNSGLTGGVGLFHKYTNTAFLRLGGVLQLDFGTGSPPASLPLLQPGLTLDLFDSPVFTGRFASVDILNATLAPGAVLDLSRLSVDGTLRVVAVPEPGTWALWLGGLAGLAWRQARRGRRRLEASRHPQTNPEP